MQDEPGSEVIDAVLAESGMSSVNWTEVIQKSIAAGVNVDGMFDELQALGLRVKPFTIENAELAGRLWKQTRQAGLSLGDRACLSLGMGLKVAVLTADRAWSSLDLSLDLRIIR